MFLQENQPRLREFARLSTTVGARADYVQGGGGNTSVKLENGWMAVKASGFCLKDVSPERAYAVLDGARLRAFYHSADPTQFADVEAAGAAEAQAAIQTVEGLTQLRPSVEAGFHSLLGTFVAHTHSVYANLAACAGQCRDIARRAFADADYAWGWVAYTDPGANLTFAIRDELRRVERETGRCPAVILLQNHGILVHADDADRCLEIHDDANGRLAAAFGLAVGSFPPVTIAQTVDGLFENTTAYLTEQLKDCRYSYNQLMEQPLYPDQLVFLSGTFLMNQAQIDPGMCVADTHTGALRMRMEGAKAQVLAETLTAVFFVMEHVTRAGCTLSTMGEAARHFIANWESEKYRKALAGKG